MKFGKKRLFFAGAEATTADRPLNTKKAARRLHSFPILKNANPDKILRVKK